MGKWYEEAVFYHMYPLGMTGAPKMNDQAGIVHRFEELNRWIPYMEELGCSAVYIGPLFESTSHGYDTIDYKVVDKRLGDNEDFKKFVDLCHESGIKVVVDGVFNHTGREFFAFKDIQENRENSKYRYWHKDINFGSNTCYNDGFSYAAWRGHYELVNLNLYDDDVKEYLFDVIKFWIDEFDIDGIRLDCADCLEFEFMKEMRRRTALWKEDFWLMGEVIHGDYARWANDEVLHSVTNYELHKGLYSGHNDHNYFEIAHTIRRQFDANGGIYKGRKLYTFVDNHDEDRIASKLNNKEHLKPVYTLLFGILGIPSIYYGSEWGIEGRRTNHSDDELRPKITLKEAAQQAEESELYSFVKLLAKIKRENEALSYGEYKELLLTNRQYAFGRLLNKNNIVIAVNNDENPAQMYVPLPCEAETAKDLITGEEIKIEDSKLEIHIPACTGMIIKLK